MWYTLHIQDRPGLSPVLTGENFLAHLHPQTAVVTLINVNVKKKRKKHKQSGEGLTKVTKASCLDNILKWKFSNMKIHKKHVEFTDLWVDFVALPHFLLLEALRRHDFSGWAMSSWKVTRCCWFCVAKLMLGFEMTKTCMRLKTVCMAGGKLRKCIPWGDNL